MIFSLKLFQNDRLLLEKSGRGAFQDVVSVKSNGEYKIPFNLYVTSTEGVELEIKCFKSLPPPPSFRVCPEAGTINLPHSLPRQGNAQFTLSSRDNEYLNKESVNTYNLNVFDYESLFNIFIHVNP